MSTAGRFTGLAAAAMAAVTVMAGGVWAQASWPVGMTDKDNVTAQLNADGTLTIYGKGDMRGVATIEKVPVQEQEQAKRNYQSCMERDQRAYQKCLDNARSDNAVSQCHEYFNNPWLTLLRCGTEGGTERTRSIPMPWNEYIGGITKVVIENGVTSVGNQAFTKAEKLTSVTIGNDVKFIGYNAFLNCGSLTSVTIGSNVTSIGDSAFFKCGSLTSVIIPNNVISIGTLAFGNNENLTSVTIGNGVTSIGEGAFANCIKLKTATIGESVKSIGKAAFSACSSLTSITIPNSVTEIGGSAFYECRRLTSVTIGNGVTSIGEGAFAYCGSLIAMTVGSSVTSIGYGAFPGENLKIITMLNPNPPKVAVKDGWGNSSEMRIDKDACILFVPEGSLYNMATFWKDFKNIRYGGAPTTQEINEIIKKDDAEKKKNEAEKKAGEYARTPEAIRNVIIKNIDMVWLNNAYNEYLKKHRGDVGAIRGDFMIYSDGSHSKLYGESQHDRRVYRGSGIEEDRSIIDHIARKWNFNFSKGPCTVVRVWFNFTTSDNKGKVGSVEFDCVTDPRFVKVETRCK